MAAKEGGVDLGVAEAVGSCLVGPVAVHGVLGDPCDPELVVAVAAEDVPAVRRHLLRDYRGGMLAGETFI